MPTTSTTSFGNALDTTPTTDEVYTIANSLPTVATITRDDANPTNANSVTASAWTSTEDVTNVDASDFLT